MAPAAPLDWEESKMEKHGTIALLLLGVLLVVGFRTISEQDLADQLAVFFGLVRTRKGK